MSKFVHQEGIVCLVGEKNQLISHSFCFLSKLYLDIDTWDWASGVDFGS